MNDFFGETLFLRSAPAVQIYEKVKTLPIIDYHCHLDAGKIRNNSGFSDIGELWLAGDHYKWRAMRMCGVEEEYITGAKSFHDKFIKFAEILPLLAGNSVYYWAHMELRQVFGISEPLNGNSAEKIYRHANKVLKNLHVQDLLERFGVVYVATTDDPCDDLDAHGKYKNTVVAPTFRPDRILACDADYIKRLSECTGREIGSLDALWQAVEDRLLYFKAHGCRISDHGFKRFPERYIDKKEAEKYFSKLASLGEKEKELLGGYFLVEFAKLYKRHGIVMQLHFSVERNVNPCQFRKVGADSGFDVIADTQKPESVIGFFRQVQDRERPETIFYTLNDANLPALVCLTGAFQNVKAGASWWFNDTVQGIRKNLSVIAEYSALGTNYGMLTDSRSFSSYVRFDFYRRLLSDFLGELVVKGEYDFDAAVLTAKKICYFNIKETLGI